MQSGGTAFKFHKSFNPDRGTLSTMRFDVISSLFLALFPPKADSEYFRNRGEGTTVSHQGRFYFCLTTLLRNCVLSGMFGYVIFIYLELETRVSLGQFANNARTPAHYFSGKYYIISRKRRRGLVNVKPVARKRKYSLWNSVNILGSKYFTSLSWTLWFVAKYWRF